MTTPAFDFAMKANDRLPSVEVDLGYEGGFLVDLTMATAIHFIMRLRDAPSGAPKVNAPAVVVDAAQGAVRYDWAAGDTDTPGVYLAEWQVTYADGRKQTFPTLTYHVITVLADLDGV